jgi:hypothetical protein
MKGKKMLSMLLVVALVLSTLMVTTTVADRKVEVDGSGNAKWILSNDGFGSLVRNLTCGEIITLQITNNSLPKSTSYRVRAWNGTAWVSLVTTGNRVSDSFGDLSISFRVPGWGELGKNPVAENGTGNWSYDSTDGEGQWNISLFSNDYTTQIFADLNATIKIGNQYYIRYKYDGNWIESLVYNSTYADGNGFEIHVFNWTGSQIVEAQGDTTKYKFNAKILRADGATTHQDYGFISENSNVNWKGIAIAVNYDHILNADREKTFWVHVYNSNDATLNSTISLPILLDVTQTSSLSGLKWGDSFTVAGKVLDGNSLGEKSYKVRVYYPVSGGFAYDEVSTPATVTTGTYSLPIVTGSGKGYGAGTWYVGTYASAGTRVDMSLEAPYVNGFIPYYSFTVGTKDTATVKVGNSADIVQGFSQTVNVSVKNETWMTGNNKEYQNMNIHITGIKGWDGSNAYERSDIALIAATKTGTNPSETLQYYEFEYTFNETGTGTIWVSWPGNLTKMDYHGSSYGNAFGNHSTSLIANITGSTTFSVVSPGAMTVLVDNVPTTVEKEAAACGGGWVNKSTAWTNISVFGATESSHKNATIKVSGCGLDFTIEESATTSNKYLNSKGWSDSGTGAWYNVSIIPKNAGTLTITVTNGTNTVVKDYTVIGLTGSVTTSIGDDLEITVGTTETITLSGVNQFAETKITFYDENWNCQSLLNASSEAGEFSFTPEIADSDWKIGYIVVVAGITAWDYYMYDIIEVVPIDDLTVKVVTPTAGNQTLTVGMEQEVMIELLDLNEDPVIEDSPGIQCRLIDDDHDWDDYLQEFTFTSIGDGQWEATILPWTSGQLVIKGYNASTGIKHIGSKTLDIDYATVEYSPGGTTAGLELEDLTIAVTAYDANGNLLDVSTLYLWAEDTSGTLAFDATVTLTDGVGEFDIDEVGDLKTHINATLQNAAPAQGNRTIGNFMINFPVFTLNPDTIYLGYPPYTTEIWASDADGNPIEGLNLTFISSIPGIIAAQPDPVRTDEQGYAQLGISPLASGKLNVTIARNLQWVGGQLNWTNAVVTDTYLTVTNLKPLTITISTLVIHQGDPLTVTVKSGGIAVEGVDVTFGTETAKTSAAGTVTINAPDPGVDFTIMKVTATKTGYATATQDITVIKTWQIQIITSANNEVNAGETFTVTISAKGQTLVGAAVSIDGKDPVYSDGAGKASFKAGSKGTTHTITATYENYLPGTVTVKAVEKDTPGFELLTLIIALGIAFILLRRRKK